MREHSLGHRGTQLLHTGADRSIVSDSDEESGERTVLGSRQQTDLVDDDDSDIGSDWSKE